MIADFKKNLIRLDVNEVKKLELGELNYLVNHLSYHVGVHDPAEHAIWVGLNRLLRQDKEFGERLASSDVNVEILKILAENVHPSVRIRVAENELILNPRIADDNGILRRLKTDSDQDVRDAANAASISIN